MRFEGALQTQLFALGLLVGAQCLADRIDQLADRALDDLELADLVLGVEQQVADRLVLLAKQRRDRRKQFVVEFDIGLLRRGAHGRLRG